MKINRLLLGSSSPFRAQLLISTGLQFEVAESKADESEINESDPVEMARLRAIHKAYGVNLPNSTSQESCLVITADQVMDFQGTAFGKAKNRDEARSRLGLFQANDHALHSAYALALLQANQATKVLISRVVTAKLWMRNLASQEIEAYLDTNEWQGTAGCYQFENKGGHLFERVEGDHSTIVGLPLINLLADLRTLGVNGLVQAQGPWELRI